MVSSPNPTIQADLNGGPISLQFYPKALDPLHGVRRRSNSTSVSEWANWVENEGQGNRKDRWKAGAPTGQCRHRPARRDKAARESSVA